MFAAQADRGNADGLFQSGRYREAITAYSGLLRQNPTDVELLEDLGQAFLRSGNPRQAIPVFQREAAIAPMRTSARRSLATAFAAVNAFGEAERIFNDLVASDPSDWTSHYRLGVLLYQNGYYQGAIDHLSRTLAGGRDALSPSEINRAEISRAIALQQTGQNTDAEKPLRQLLAAPENSANLDLLLSYTRLLDETGRYPEALSQTDLAIAADPRNASAHLWRAIIFQHQNQLPRALAEAEQSRDLAPQSPAPRNLLVRLYRKMERMEDADREAAWLREQELREQEAIANRTAR